MEMIIWLFHILDVMNQSNLFLDSSPDGNSDTFFCTVFLLMTQ